MTERVHPSSTKPIPTAPTKVTGTLPTVLNPPPNKSTNLYNPNRHPLRQKHQRRCMCLTCFWSLLILITIILLVIISCAAFYVLYHPERPTFSVTSLKISSFNMTKNPSDDTTHLTTNMNLTVSVKNTNKKFIFFYDPVFVSVMSKAVMIGNGSFTNFTSSPNSVLVMHGVMGTSGQVLTNEDLEALDKDMKKRNGLALDIVVDTMVRVKMEKVKVRKVGMRVKCEGIRGVFHEKGRIVVNTVKGKCKVDLRVKIWKFTF